MWEIYQEINTFFDVGTKPPKKLTKIRCTFLHQYLGFLISHYIFERVLGVVGCFFLIQRLMVERAPQNEWFFIHFSMFTSSLVYRVVWNQSLWCGFFFKVGYGICWVVLSFLCEKIFELIYLLEIIITIFFFFFKYLSSLGIWFLAYPIFLFIFSALKKHLPRLIHFSFYIF